MFGLARTKKPSGVLTAKVHSLTARLAAAEASLTRMAEKFEKAAKKTDSKITKLVDRNGSINRNRKLIAEYIEHGGEEGKFKLSPRSSKIVLASNDDVGYTVEEFRTKVLQPQIVEAYKAKMTKKKKRRA